MAEAAVGVVIPHFRAPEALQVALAHVQAQAGVRTEVFVRDNSEDNILYTRAVNEGLRRFVGGGQHEFVLLLNQDANLHQGSLLAMVQAMQAHPEVGICGAVALSANGSVNFAGGADAYPWGMHMVFQRERLPAQPFGVHWVNGACMMLRTRMLRDIGLLDENMRFICSDGDICFTARSRGWQCMVVPNAFVDHEPAGSMDESTPWINKVKYEDQLYFARKWLTGGVYRSLAVEGDRLSAETVQQCIAHACERIAYYQQILSSPQA